MGAATQCTEEVYNSFHEEILARGQQANRQGVLGEREISSALPLKRGS